MADDLDTTTVPVLLLDRYRVEGFLGEGGLGMVVKAFDTRLKRMVAIKTLKRASYAADPDQFRALEERFAREAEAGSRMGSHPNIVGVHDLIIDAEQTQYLVLEYLPGGNLAERIARGFLPLADTLRLAIEIARGLQAAHEMGLVHRDIKPANVFLTASAQAKVGDFGIAQIDDISGRTRATSGHPGTPLYMSPEQESMTAYLRPASDQYSLGLVAFEMTTGQIYKRIGPRQGAQLLAERAAPVQALIARMLADNPDDRYPTMADVVHALREIERRVASAETRIAPRAGAETPTAHDADNLVATRQNTPRVGLQPMPPIASYAPPPALPTTPRYSRRAVLIGAGGLALTAGTAGVAMATLRKSDAPVATATPPVGTSVAAAAQPTAPPTISPTATGIPVATALPIVITAPPAAPIVVTAPPIVITATPLPTPIATPTTFPQPTQTSTPIPRTQTATGSSSTSWSDPERRITLSYATQRWHEVKDGTDQYTILGLQNTDSVLFYVSKYVRGSANALGSALDGIQGYKDRQLKIADRTYVQGPIQQLRIDGATAASMDFQWTKKSDPSVGRAGTVWYIDGFDRQFVLETYVDGKTYGRSDDVTALINAVRITK